MVQQITIPLEWANTIPGVVGVEDVEFSIPTLEDIQDAIDDLTIDLPDVEALLDDFVDDVVAEIDAATVDIDAIVDAIIDELEARIEDIILDVDDVADAVVDALSLEDIVSDQVNISGIFGPLTEDVVRAFEDILNEVLGAIDDLPDDFDSIVAAVNEVLNRVPVDFGQAVRDAIRDFVEDVPGGDILLDPQAFIREEVLAFTDGLIDTAVADDLNAAVDSLLETIDNL